MVISNKNSKISSNSFGRTYGQRGRQSLAENSRKALQVMDDDDDSLDDVNDVKQVAVGQLLVDWLQDPLYAQLTKGKLLEDIQIAWLDMSIKSHRKAFSLSGQEEDSQECP